MGIGVLLMEELIGEICEGFYGGAIVFEFVLIGAEAGKDSYDVAVDDSKGLAKGDAGDCGSGVGANAWEL